MVVVVVVEMGAENECAYIQHIHDTYPVFVLNVIAKGFTRLSQQLGTETMEMALFEPHLLIIR